MCDATELAVVYLVDGARKYRGRRGFWRHRFTICPDCYTTGFEPGTERPSPAGRERDRVRWQDVVGRGALMTPTPCVACGLTVIRNADPLLKRVTCSPSCATSLTRSRNGGRGSPDPCAGCGQPIETGRSDSRFCGSACRQRAYRQRVKDSQP